MPAVFIFYHFSNCYHSFPLMLLSDCFRIFFIASVEITRAQIVIIASRLLLHTSHCRHLSLSYSLEQKEAVVVVVALVVCYPWCCFMFVNTWDRLVHSNRKNSVHKIKTKGKRFRRNLTAPTLNKL